MIWKKRIMMDYNFDELEKKLSQLNLLLTDKMKQQFAIYYEVLCEWNKVMNLTSITEFDEIGRAHV